MPKEVRLFVGRRRDHFRTCASARASNGSPFARPRQRACRSYQLLPGGPPRSGARAASIAARPSFVTRLRCGDRGRSGRSSALSSASLTKARLMAATGAAPAAALL